MGFIYDFQRWRTTLCGRYTSFNLALNLKRYIDLDDTKPPYAALTP